MADRPPDLAADGTPITGSGRPPDLDANGHATSPVTPLPTWTTQYPKTAQIARGALNTLPAIGAMVGGALSTPETLGAGTIPGIALGAGVGRGARDLIGHLTMLDAPTTPTEKALHIAGDTAMTGATAALAPGVMEFAKAPVRTVLADAQEAGTMLPQSVRRVLSALPGPKTGAVLERPPWQTWAEAPTASEAPTAAPEAAAAAPVAEVPAPPSSAISPAERTALLKQGYTPQMIDGFEAQLSAKTPEALRGTLRAMPEPGPTRPPIQADASSLPESPLQQPRVDVGAEQVGRTTGQTKEQVRAATAPILGEQQGEASPIFPQQTLGKITDALRALPPGGPERDAYVARAPNGKSQWQIETLRRQLEHLGLVAPLAVGGGMAAAVKAEIQSRLQKGDQ